MDDLKEFILILAGACGALDQQDLQGKMQELGEEGLKQLYEVYQQVKGKGSPEQIVLVIAQAYLKLTQSDQGQSEIASARLGAKLQYIQQLRGICPEGMEVERYMRGGCVKCRQKEKEKAVERFKKDKCGGKVKKRIKSKEDGGKMSKRVNPKTGDLIETKRYSNGTTATRTTTEDNEIIYKGRNGKQGPQGSNVGDSLANADWNTKLKMKVKPTKHWGGGSIAKAIGNVPMGAISLPSLISTRREYPINTLDVEPYYGTYYYDHNYANGSTHQSVDKYNEDVETKVNGKTPFYVERNIRYRTPNDTTYYIKGGVLPITVNSQSTGIDRGYYNRIKNYAEPLLWHIPGGQANIPRLKNWLGQ